ncbi:MAG: tRNA preQ1(34) S-adenosylmethionine ribosyltransferase-isomerase QueA [Oscillospiraceae bacterium]|jgi:S-adenosylmethionine:tRNA ribosyltransferase-isomerase|nr:tRNA preQ1(34) S-adenosylmethionine ribosyltransferase-isomerase QueA [Oscillospiraceae bacterium]
MTDLKRTDFYYELPERLIAQTPAEPRDASRLMVVDRAGGGIRHDFFFNIADYVNKGDLLVLNDSKVFPARLLGVRRGGEVGAELLLLEQKGENLWEALVKPGRRLKKGAAVDFGGDLSAEILGSLEGGTRLVRFHFDGDFFEILDKIGNMPTPPYITEKLKDNSRYNTIFARETGSAAAPTAGLHFTERVFSRLAAKGAEIAYITLHVGLGTFRPVKSPNISGHKMHAERFRMSEETARKIRESKARGNRVIAVGTTSCRVLESVSPRFAPRFATTDIFITPGYDFKAVDGLITNFHLPESTLLMLVSAFMGREEALRAYAEAIKEGYGFFSFGDAMMII